MRSLPRRRPDVSCPRRRGPSIAGLSLSRLDNRERTLRRRAWIVRGCGSMRRIHRWLRRGRCRSCQSHSARSAVGYARAPSFARRGRCPCSHRGRPRRVSFRRCPRRASPRKRVLVFHPPRCARRSSILCRRNADNRVAPCRQHRRADTDAQAVTPCGNRWQCGKEEVIREL